MYKDLDYDVELDVRRMTCPMPVLKTRKKIKEIGNNKVLKIIGDFQPAKKNIQEFLKKEGYPVLKVEDIGKEYIIYTKT
ncbi:MAG: sulfurtransferase TusA family protein [Candidatus Helarchaeota archaeon]